VNDPYLLNTLANRIPAFRNALEKQESGDYLSARSAYLDLIDLPELTAICLHQLGTIAYARGEVDRSIQLFKKTIQLDNSILLAYQNLGIVLHERGLEDEALSIDIHIGCLLQMHQKYQDAQYVYQHILDKYPLNYPAQANIGTCLAWIDHLPSALSHLLAAIELYGRIIPECAAFHNKLLAQLRTNPTLPLEVIDLPDGYASGNLEKIEEVLTTLGKVLTHLKCPQEAILCHKEAIRYAPGFALGHWNLAIALLADKQFIEGWQEYEWRWFWDKMPEPKRLLPYPTWEGQVLNQQSILVWGEQGSGDIIQFSPLVKALATMATQVVFEVPVQLVRLFEHNMAPIPVISRPDHPNTLTTQQPFNFVVPLMSLPHRLKLRAHQLPLARDYLHPIPQDCERLAHLFSSSPHPKIGLVWAGSPKHQEDQKRSIPFEEYLSFIEDIPNANWYSLQVGERESDLSAYPSLSMTSLAPYLRDFADTAAAISFLDLVITVDTGVAHLAGAMGKETWLLLPYVAEWRWEQEESITPWYPSLKLFRQTEADNWSTVMDAIKESWDKTHAHVGTETTVQETEAAE
jgi:tetratricopeptide (TPR) repeat protein